MTNYFKVYLISKNRKITKRIAKNKEEVFQILRNAKKEGLVEFNIVKRIKPSTDIPIGYGKLSQECKVRLVDNLEKDWRVVGQNVVDWDKYKKYKEDEER